MFDDMKKSIQINSVPVLGEVIRFQSEDGRITQGEVAELRKQGAELWAVIREARADGKIQMHEILLIVKEGLDVAGLSIWQKVGRFFRRLFGRKS